MPARLSTFHCFPALPLELRRYVWQIARPAPNMILIETECPEYKDPLPQEYIWWPRARDGISKLLLVCQESRRETLRACERLDGNDGYIFTYIDWDRDTIGFGSYYVKDAEANLHRFVRIAEPRVLSSIQRIALQKYESLKLFRNREISGDVTHSKIFDALPTLEGVIACDFSSYEPGICSHMWIDDPWHPIVNCLVWLPRCNAIAVNDRDGRWSNFQHRVESHAGDVELLKRSTRIMTLLIDSV
ncbi:hypothetical protein PVAG01_06478 [Phlyctema vagabunda]|uniref:2EXR domain-containing protein n=1 Tax=Phlyctema vagabunda TaxID=108571 RepID=A0ABR4PG63_9HELO